MKTALFAAAALALALPGCNSSAPTSAAAASPPATPTVDVVPVVAQPLSIEVRLPGELQPYEAVAVFPKIAGFVEWIGVDRGSRVKAGQLLARISAPEVGAQRAEAQSRSEAARSQVATAEAKLAADESTYEKLKSASQTPGVVAGNDLLQGQKMMDADQAQLRAAQRNAEAAAQAVQAVTATEQYLSITAPFDGVVIERNDHPGALVGPNQAAPLLRIETLNRLRLVVAVPENYSADVPEGAQVPFTVPSFPGQEFAGKLARVSHAVDVRTRTMPVEIEVSNPAGKLAPGTFAEVRWPVHRSTATLFVPTSSIATNLERNFVIRVRGGKAEWVDVKTGATAGKLTEVFGDLRAGDEVAVRGTDELKAGTQVVARTAPAS